MVKRMELASSAYHNGASIDSRSSYLYLDEQHSLTTREALSLLAKSWQFIRPHHHLVALKFLLAIGALPIFLLIPWPLKIIIDNVINGRPLQGSAHYVLFPLTGGDRLHLLAVVTGLLFRALLLVGMAGDHTQRVDAHVANGGLDQAGLTANEANNGWSLFGGCLGLLEVWVTLVLTQRLNQTVRTAVYERLLHSPLRLFADQKVGDAVFRVMYDSAAIGEVLYSGILSPVISISVITLVSAVLWVHFPSDPLVPILAAGSFPVTVLASALFGRRLRDQNQKMREHGSAVMAAFEENAHDLMRVGGK